MKFLRMLIFAWKHKLYILWTSRIHEDTIGGPGPFRYLTLTRWGTINSPESQLTACGGHIQEGGAWVVLRCSMLSRQPPPPCWLMWGWTNPWSTDWYYPDPASSASARRPGPTCCCQWGVRWCEGVRVCVWSKSGWRACNSFLWVLDGDGLEWWQEALSWG